MHLNTVVNLIDSYRREQNIEVLVETWNGESARFYTDLPPYIKTFTHCYGAWQPPKVQFHTNTTVATKTSVVQKADLIVTLNKALAEKKLRLPRNNFMLIKQLAIYRDGY